MVVGCDPPLVDVLIKLMRKLNSVEEILETAQMGRERKSKRQIKKSERKRSRIKLKPFIDLFLICIR